MNPEPVQAAEASLDRLRPESGNSPPLPRFTKGFNTGFTRPFLDPKSRIIAF